MVAEAEVEVSSHGGSVVLRSLLAVNSMSMQKSPEYQNSRVICFNAEYGCRNCGVSDICCLYSIRDRIKSINSLKVTDRSVSPSLKSKMVKWRFLDVEDTLQSLVVVHGVDVVECFSNSPFDRMNNIMKNNPLGIPN